jgi:hypothetical protein
MVALRLFQRRVGDRICPLAPLISFALAASSLWRWRSRASRFDLVYPEALFISIKSCVTLKLSVVHQVLAVS